MKKYLNIIAIGILVMTFLSCKDDSFNYPEGMVGSSKVTVYPILTMSGDQYIFVAKGAAYTEPGVIAKVGADEIDVKTDGQVNTSAAAVYTLSYSAANADGFSASVERYVVVYDTKADAAGNDYSGTYKRSGFATVAVWTKVAPGVYFILNPGGAVNNTDVVVAINPTGSTIQIPPQGSPMGAFSSTVATMSGGYSWVLDNAGYGKALRVFTKQ